MPKWLKVVLAVFGVAFVLCLAASAGAYWWFDRNKDALKASGEAAKKEGKAFAYRADAEGCVDEGLRRLGLASGIVDQAVNNLFVEACLEAAAQPPKFCDGVPTIDQYVVSATWAVERCTAKGYAQDQVCARLMQVVQKHCHRK
jgi:hypothetical protein